MKREEINKRVVIVDICLTNLARKTLGEPEGVTIEEIQSDQESKKWESPLRSEEIKRIFEDAITEGLIQENEPGKFWATEKGTRYAKEERTKEAMRLILLGQQTM
ncbi:MAG: hypothetical protein FJ044_05080 [Candidatus Cloacimonetes bacterium]|nr:hypothetical protein [Candidatus Cloacimonadota bacterium]